MLEKLYYFQIITKAIFPYFSYYFINSYVLELLFKKIKILNSLSYGGKNAKKLLYAKKELHYSYFSSDLSKVIQTNHKFILKKKSFFKNIIWVFFLFIQINHKTNS